MVQAGKGVDSMNPQARYLGLIDLNPKSPTYGCADRNYWHYFDGKGFPVGSFQVGMLGFYLYGLDWVSDALLHFWTKQIEKKGMLDEYFLNQKSFCATAHTAYAAAILMALMNRDRRQPNSAALEALSTALRNLASDHERPESANQSLAAQVALDVARGNLGLSLDLPDFTVPRSGELPLEYGGFDLAYSLKCIDLCVYAISVLPLNRQGFYVDLLNSMLKALNEISAFGFHPGLSSRGNPHRIVGGLTKLARVSPTANRILKFVTGQIPEMTSEAEADDKYFSFFHFNSLALDKLDLPHIELSEHTPVGSRELFWPDLGIAAIRHGEECWVLSSCRGGAALQINGQMRNFVHGLVSEIDGDVLSPCERASAHLLFNSQKKSARLTFKYANAKSSVMLAQNWVFQFALKFLMNSPLAGLVRRRIYARSTAKINAMDSLTLDLIWGGLSVESKWRTIQPGLNPNWVGNWSFTDGHATRQHAQLDRVFLSRPQSSEPLREL